MIADLRWLHGVEWTYLSPEEQAECGGAWLARHRERERAQRGA